MSAALRCRKCHKPLVAGSQFCHLCGTKVTPDKAKATHRSPNSGSIYKVSDRKRKPWVALAPKVSGKRKLIGTFATHLDAEKALLDYLGAYSDRQDWTLKQFYEAFTQSPEYAALTESSQGTHRTAWSYFSDIADVKMAELKASHFQTVVDSAVSAGRKRSVCEKIRNLASLLCQEAMRDDVVNKNYARLLKLPKNDTETKDVFTAEEIAILHAHDSDYEARLILILIYTGMRISELLQLRNEDIDTELWYAIGGEKTDAGRNRIIPFVSSIRPYITGFMSNHELLVHKNGTPMRREYFEKYVFKRYLVRLGILEEPKDGERWRLSPHSTRHTLTTLSRKAGIKEDVIARVVGHTTYETTDKHYVQLDAKFLVSQMERITDANTVLTDNIISA